jgi:hypothetical protein
MMQASLAIVGGVCGLLAYFSAFDWRWLRGTVVLPANWSYTIFIIMPPLLEGSCNVALSMSGEALLASVESRERL